MEHEGKLGHVKLVGIRNGLVGPHCTGSGSSNGESIVGGQAGCQEPTACAVTPVEPGLEKPTTSCKWIQRHKQFMKCEKQQRLGCIM